MQVVEARDVAKVQQNDIAEAAKVHAAGNSVLSNEKAAENQLALEEKQTVEKLGGKIFQNQKKMLHSEEEKVHAMEDDEDHQLKNVAHDGIARLKKFMREAREDLQAQFKQAEATVDNS